MAFSDYTKPDDVRAVLGVSIKEIADSVIESGVYLTTVLEALYKLNATLAEDYRTASGTAQRTSKQNRFVLLVQTYCSYIVARQLIPNLPMAAPQIITDGKTALNRIANPYEHLKEPIDASISYFGANLIEAYADINSAVVVPVAARRTMVKSSGLAVDPVTG